MNLFIYFNVDKSKTKKTLHNYKNLNLNGNNQKLF